MMRLLQKLKPLPLASLLFWAASGLLALHPLEWLMQTWSDPSYDSPGVWIFLAVAVLFLWSVTSPKYPGDANHRTVAFWLFIGTSLLRLLSQVMAVNVIGAMALVVDVYALGLLFGLERRLRAISPGWLAILFAFSLPVTHLLQRTLGFGLQQLSAQEAAHLLSFIYPDVVNQGIRILLGGQDVLVDLPCSGAQSVTILMIFYVVLMCVRRPNLFYGMMGLGLSLTAALVCNTVRITLLAIGIAYPETFGGVDVMDAPWHDLFGLVSLLVFGMLPILFWKNFVRSGSGWLTHFTLPGNSWAGGVVIQSRMRLGLSVAFLAGAVLIVNLPQTPLDVSREVAPITLPTFVHGSFGKTVPLSPNEKNYFTRYGGQAAKMRYGDHALLVVRTGAPLRHLHNPSECLRGLGFQVKYLGMRHEGIPSAVYSASSPGGEHWRIAVSFVSSDGDSTPSVSEAVWRWFQKPDTTWTAIQRISPLTESPADTRAWEQSVAAALELPAQKPVVPPYRISNSQLKPKKRS